MIAEAFMLCALSLASPHFTHPPLLMANNVHDEYAELLKYVEQVYPGSSVRIEREKDDAKHFSLWGYIRTPFRWRHFAVWIKRAA